MKVAQLGEFGLIERIRRKAAVGRMRLGIGDDCAAQALAPGELLLTTTDLLVEGVHFRREWTSLRLLGRKSVSVNVSDVAAMGGEPRALYLALALPPDLTVEDAEEFAEGVLEAAAAYGAVLAGGDTCRSTGPLLISVTAEGAVPEEEILPRTGARPGDALYVSGTLGDSALALRQLLAGGTPSPFLAARHHDPTARVTLGRALASAGAASAMIDLSDGLLADLGHILKGSGVGARIEAGRLPLSPPFREALAAEPALIELALGGGEDYELLFSVPPQVEGMLPAIAVAGGVPLARIGTVLPASEGLCVVATDGRLWEGTARGFDHFA